MNNEIDRATSDTREFLDARPAPDVRAAVMSRIQELEPLALGHGRLRRLALFLWGPRQVTIRPVFALAAVGAMFVLVLLPYSSEELAGPAQVAERPAGAQMFVQFRLEAAASRVQLAGSFSNWEPRYELRQSVPGVWTITVPLVQGVHDYAFVIDGNQWVPDPYAPQIGDGFGGTNSRLALLSPDMPQL